MVINKRPAIIKYLTQFEAFISDIEGRLRELESIYSITGVNAVNIDYEQVDTLITAIEGHVANCRAITNSRKPKQKEYLKKFNDDEDAETETDKKE